MMLPRIIIYILFLHFIGLCQDLKVPENLELKNKEDYKRTEKFVVDCIDYLQNSPVNEKSDNIKIAMTFSIKWITGCPYITINVTALMNSVNESNSIFTIIYLGGWTKSAINSKKKLTDVEGNVAGIKSVLEYYKNNEELERNDLLDKLLEFDQDELIKWVEKKLKEINKSKA